MAGLTTGKEGVLRGLPAAPQSYRVGMGDLPTIDQYASTFTDPIDAQRKKELFQMEKEAHEYELKRGELELDLLEMEAEESDREQRSNLARIKALKKLFKDPQKKMILENQMIEQQMAAEAQPMPYSLHAEQERDRAVQSVYGTKGMPEHARLTISEQSPGMSFVSEMPSQYLPVEQGATGTRLSPQEEAEFQNWMQTNPNVVAWRDEFKESYGEDPQVDDSDYDYRGAWKAGLTPSTSSVDGKYHWGSIGVDGRDLKSEDHPTRWKSDYMRMTGNDPDAIGINKEDALIEMASLKSRPSLPAEQFQTRQQMLLADPTFVAGVRAGDFSQLKRWEEAGKEDADDMAKAMKPMTEQERAQRDYDMKRIQMLTKELGYKEDLLLNKMSRGDMTMDDVLVIEEGGTKFLIDKKERTKLGWVEAPEASKYEVEWIHGDSENGTAKIGTDVYVFKNGVPYKPESTVRHISKGDEDSDDGWSWEDDDAPPFVPEGEESVWKKMPVEIRKKTYGDIAPSGGGTSTGGGTATGGSGREFNVGVNKGGVYIKD